MLEIKISPNKKVWVSFCDDVDPNEGGYYCQVYDDPNCENEIDNFVINKGWFRDTNDDERMKKAIGMAKGYVKGIFK